MCYNCGCEMPDNDMGDPKNITNKTFEEAAKAADQPVEEAKKANSGASKVGSEARTEVAQ